MHASHRLPDLATYARGRDRLDYVLASPTVYQSVTACGYDPFNERFFSDHRGYFVDLNIDQLFGNELQHLAALPFRDVRGRDTKSVTSYVEAKDKYLQDHDFYSRIQRLKGLQQADPELAEAIDRDWLRGSKTAGKRARHAKKTWWSSELAKAKQETNLYRTLLSMLRQNRDYSAQLSRLRSANPTESLPDNKKDCSKALRDSRKKEREIIKASLKYREDEMLQHITLSQLKGDKSKSDILRNIRKAEEIKQMFNKLRFIRGKNNKSGMALSNYALQFNHSFDRWKTIVNVIILFNSLRITF